MIYSYALEKDVKQSSVLAVPQLYSDCQNSKVIKYKKKKMNFEFS